MRRITFTNGRDETVEFYHRPFLITKVEGLGETDADIQTVKSPYVDGETFIDAMLEMRDITMEGTITTANRETIMKHRKKLSKIFNPKIGMGEFKIEKDGMTRVIDCIADGTPEFPDKENSNRQKFVITLTCPNPYWRDQNQVSRALKSYEGYFKLPFKLPFQLGKQGDRTTLVNDGDIPVPIKIDLEGPVTRPEIRNSTTDEFIRINTSISRDEILHIDTTPGKKRIEAYKGDKVRSLFGQLDYANGASFWQLETGENEVEYYSDEGNKEAVVAVSWHNMYSGI